MNKRLPHSIDLVDSTITIEKRKVANAIGFSDYQESKIIIDPSIAECMVEEVFYHELVHWILYKMHNRLEADEKFVGLFGSLLNQAMKTVKFQYPRDGKGEKG